MNAKQLLSEYTDACELIKETEQDIRRLETEKSTVVCDKVKGSMREFPYTERNFAVSGISDRTAIEKKIDSEYAVLEERKRKAEEIKQQVQAIINRATPRMQRIIRYKYLEGLTWRQISLKLHNATEEGVRKEFERFLKKI
jgi:DNA-directed RNA polymerase specialized sigma24 family protein|nr:MAG TPA: Protein of unknown function (DUF722) [Caudoviricetes sp.]